MWVIIHQFKIFVLEVENILHVRINLHFRKWTRLTGELQIHLFQMVEIQVRIADGMHEVACLQTGHLSYHHQQQGIRGNVERYAQEGVSTALVHLEAQSSVRYIELEEHVAGWQVHVLDVRHIPGIHDDASGVRVILDLLDGFADLVDVTTLVVGPRAPLVAIDMAEVAVLVRPFVPDADTVLLQILHVGVALEEPQQFVDDGLEVQFLGGEEGESVLQVEAHLMAEHADGAGAGAVFFLHAFRLDALQ